MFAGLKRLWSACADLAEALYALAGTARELNAELRRTLALDVTSAPVPLPETPGAQDGSRTLTPEEASPEPSTRNGRRKAGAAA